MVKIDKNLYFRLVLWKKENLIAVLTGMIEEMCQINVVNSVGIFGKTDSPKKDLVNFRRTAKGVVNAAQIDKVESGASDNEQCLSVLDAFDVGEIDKLAAFIGHGKLTKSHKLTVNGSRISHKLGFIFNSAAEAYCLLQCFFLDG